MSKRVSKGKIEEKDIQVELIRVIAMIFVVAIHCLKSIDTQASEFNYWMFNIGNTLFLTCNGLFFMISGKLNLKIEISGDKKGISTYYKKRIVGVLIPMLLGMMLLYLYDIRSSLDELTLLKFIRGYLTNVVDGYSHQHFWFMYVLIGVLLAVPFISKMVHSLTEYELKCLLVIGSSWTILSFLIQLIGYEIPISGYPFISWTFYFLLGYALDRLELSARTKKTLIVVGIVSLAITSAQMYLFRKYSNMST